MREAHKRLLRGDLPSLLRVGLIHVQFETIHPFLDGNGRLGRLLIALLLVDADRPRVLRETTGRRRDRTFAYRAYLDRLREGTELER